MPESGPRVGMQALSKWAKNHESNYKSHSVLQIQIKITLILVVLELRTNVHGLVVFVFVLVAVGFR